jgi:prepilin-type N-terminal cleavage/methylation domain-containing protein
MPSEAANQKGMTLIETAIAMGLLAVGLMGMATMVPFAVQNDLRLRNDTTASFIASRHLEAMMTQPYTVASFTGAADGAGNTATVNLTCGAPPCSAGAQLVNGFIDFGGQTYAAVPANYKRLYTVPFSADAAEPNVNGGTYEVRWHVKEDANRVRHIVIAVRLLGNSPGNLSVPVNLRVVRME